MADEWRVLLPESIDSSGPESISDFGACTGISEYESVRDALDDIGRYDAIIVRGAELDADVLDRADRLKIIAKHGVGLDKIDIEAASEQNILVCNTPGENSRSVAEHAIALLFGVRRNLRTADAHVRKGGWDRGAFVGHELTGDVLGLFGYGATGREAADLALGMGLEVVTFDHSTPDEIVRDGVERIDDLLTLFEQSNAVSIHVPLTDKTCHSISTDELRALGPEGVLINTARGPIVDEAALVDSLQAGDLGGAGLDVFETEPPGDANPLSARDDVLLTPHVGGITDASMERMSRRAAANVRTVYEGGLPESTVNANALDRTAVG